MSDDGLTRRFVREALPLIASYFHSEQVILEPTDVTSTQLDDDEFVEFENDLRLRHAVACGLRLKPILEAIERNASETSRVIRAESKGILAGRLDIPLYLSRRGRNLSWPRAFPVLVAEATPETPENQLVFRVLRELGHRLELANSIGMSAERTYSLSLLRWSRERLRSDPWARLTSSQNVGRLRREAEHRFRKRQTGNQPAYGSFLSWLNQWQFDPSQSSPEDSEKLLDLIFAFPADNFFEDRVFEIWCLHQAIESLRRCGAEITAGPRPLAQRGERSICQLSFEGYHVEVWFQRSLPSSVARWTYTHSQKPLRGIPDITIIGSDGRRLLVDAKRREVRTQTRSEETYKMLGYVENFRHAFLASPFWAVLCFLSNGPLFTELSAAGGHKIFLIGAHNDDPVVCPFKGSMDTLISEWLSARRLISEAVASPSIN